MIEMAGETRPQEVAFEVAPEKMEAVKKEGKRLVGASSQAAARACTHCQWPKRQQHNEELARHTHCTAQKMRGAHSMAGPAAQA